MIPVSEETVMVPKELLDAIPQTDPRAGYLAQRPAIDAAITQVLDGGLYVLGREVEIFEAAFAAFIGTAYAIGVGSGTDAIELALRACGIGSGDLVFTVSHTAVATVAAIERAGATAVLSDVGRDSIRWIRTSCRGGYARHLPVGLHRCCLCQPAELAALPELARAYGLG